ncbi:MAG: N-acetyltransferase [Lysobacterales bacterium]|nr:MAG: N-acetyltransferase [Xanthomonadales bacterium]
MALVQTGRLELRHAGAEDAPFVLELLNEPSFVANIGDRGVRTVAQARDYVAERMAASYAAHGYGMYVVEHRGTRRSMGLCGLVRRPFLEAPDIGFAFLPAYWSQGYAEESARAVMEWAPTFGLTRVLGVVLPTNEPSVRLLRKLGLEYERDVVMPESGDTCALYACAVERAS